MTSRTDDVLVPGNMFAEEAACGAALFSYAAIKNKDVLKICEDIVKYSI